MSEETPDDFLSPEDVIEGLRALQRRIAKFSPLTSKERESLRIHSKLPQGVKLSAISAIGSTERMQLALGTGSEEAFQMDDQLGRWGAVEQEAKAFLDGISGANFLRRRAIALLVARAWMIAQQLAHDDENAPLRAHVREMRRQRSYWRRKGGEPPPETPPEGEET